MGSLEKLGCCVVVMSIGLTSAWAAAACGPLEDERRASYRQLGWEDFRGPAPVGLEPPGRRHPMVVAQTATSVALDAWEPSLSAAAEGGWLARATRVCVRAYMHKYRSGKASRRPGRAVLAHEQGHFDIAQLFAGILAARIEALSVRAGSPPEARTALRREIWAIYAGTMVEFEQMQKRYERRTSFGRSRAQQARWTEEVAARLAQFASARREGALPVATAAGPESPIAGPAPR